MIQRAVRRNSRSPDFEGLECFLANSLDPHGGLVALDFERYIAEVQKSEAQVLKQQRLAKEETEANEKRKQHRGKNQGGAAPAAQ